VTTTAPFDVSEPLTTIASEPLVVPVTTLDSVTNQPTSTVVAPVVLSSPRASVPFSLKNDSLRLGLGDLEFKLSNVSGLLQKVVSFTNTSTLSFPNVTHHLGQLIDGVNITALKEQFEAIKAYVASSVTMQVLLVCCTLLLFVGCGMMSLVVRLKKDSFMPYS
jgi:hypothetical protein